MRDASGVVMGCKEPAWSPRHFSNTHAGLDALVVQSWTNICLPNQSSHIPLTPPAQLLAGSSLQEVAAHQELSECSALHLSTCFQSLLQEKMPGKGNGVMEKLAELPLVGTAQWMRDTRVPCWGTTPVV